MEYSLISKLSFDMVGEDVLIMGATKIVNVNKMSIKECRKQMGLIGFDIGLEMSGNASAFESMLENMYHGGRIALLGIFPSQAKIDLKKGLK